VPPSEARSHLLTKAMTTTETAKISAMWKREWKMKMRQATWSISQRRLKTVMATEKKLPRKVGLYFWALNYQAGLVHDV
jgi:hypothetical protein